MTPDETPKVRLDKWLWAARFFKTRSLAATAIETGKVEVNGERAKRAKQLQAGDRVAVRLGPYTHDVEVLALSERRGPASEAAKLYAETPEGKKARELLREQMKAAAPAFGYESGKPTKKDRRALQKLRRKG
ncbi:MAG TPA: RNA-binding S4 domain-containing protein [Gemmatimonadaceae bacterium]|nr:RNA-binding S4 domain-containing protein [Gemmatimonadaceae bacterium]